MINKYEKYDKYLNDIKGIPCKFSTLQCFFSKCSCNLITVIMIMMTMIAP